MTNDSKLTQPLRSGTPIRATFTPRHDHERGPRTRVTVSGVIARDLDVTANVTCAIAHALWQARGGHSIDNWTEAERILEQLSGVTARSEPAPVAADPAPARPKGNAGVGRASGGEVVVPSRRR